MFEEECSRRTSRKTFSFSSSFFKGSKLDEHFQLHRFLERGIEKKQVERRRRVQVEVASCFFFLSPFFFAKSHPLQKEIGREELVAQDEKTHGNTQRHSRIFICIFKHSRARAKSGDFLLRGGGQKAKKRKGKIVKRFSSLSITALSVNFPPSSFVFF